LFEARATGCAARASPPVARRLGNLLLMFVLASISEVRFPGLLLLTREIEELPFASAVACSATKK